MTINELASLLVDGEHWDDIEDILDMNIIGVSKNRLYSYLVTELTENTSMKKIDMLIEKYE